MEATSTSNTTTPDDGELTSTSTSTSATNRAAKGTSEEKTTAPASIDDNISSSTTTPQVDEAVVVDDAPISARRAKAMSIGNAASLFGTPNDDAGAAGLFGGGSGDFGSAKPAFEDIGEEEEGEQDDHEQHTAHPPASSSSLSAQIPTTRGGGGGGGGLPSPSDDAAGLFGDENSGSSSAQVEWLSGGGTASSSAGVDNIFAAQPSYTSQQPDPSLYASAQGQGQGQELYGDGQYSYANNNNNSSSSSYGTDYSGTQQPYQQQFNGTGNGSDVYAYQQSQQQPQQQYGYYDQPAPDNFNQSMYYDPSQQLQYQQTLQAEAHHPQSASTTSQYASGMYAAQTPYDPSQQQQQYQQQQQQQPYPAAGQDQYASYYSQQSYTDPQVNPSSSYQYQQQQASQYAQPQQASSYPSYPEQQQQQQYAPSSTAQPQQPGYLQTQQSYQAPHSAPASSAQMNTLARSQSAQATHKQTYAQSYTAAYDPYAPDPNDPYGSQSMQPQASSSSSTYSHRAKQPSLTSSKTAPHLASSLHPAQSSTAASGKHDKNKDPKLNRSASSFFAELPPMPVKSRPASALGARGANQSMPPLPGFTSTATGVTPPASIPPPPKSKSPLPPPAASSHSQRPPSRTKSAQSNQHVFGTTANTWSPTISSGSYSRPGSRTADRQGSIGSAASQPSQPGTSRSSAEYNHQAQAGQSVYMGQSSAHQQYTNGNPGLTGANTYTQDPYAQNNSGLYNGQHGQYDEGSAPASSRNSLDSHASYSKPQSSAEYGAAREPSRPQSRQAQSTAHTSQSPPASSHPMPPPLTNPVTSKTAPDARQPSSAATGTSSLKAEPVSPPRALEQRSQSTEESTVDSLTAQMQGQSLVDDAETKPLLAAGGSTPLTQAIETALPSSEPDTDAIIRSPSQKSDEWQLSLSPTSQRSIPKSPPPPNSSVPSLEISSPSPGVEAKPMAAMQMDKLGTHDFAQEQERQVEAELLEAEREIKMEEDAEADERKPDIRQLQHQEIGTQWAQPSTMYGMDQQSMYSEEEQKPSKGQLQNAWQPEAYSNDQDGYDPNPYGAEPTYAYGQHATDSQPMSSAYEQYGAYDQPSGATAYGINQGGESAPSEPEYNSSYVPGQQSQPYKMQEQPSDVYGVYQTSQPYNASYDHPASHASQPAPNGHDRLRNRPAVPIATFGLNGRLVTFFPSGSISPVSAYGAPYGDSSSAVASIKIQRLSDLLPTESVTLDSFPGPLFMDSTATNASGKAKKKKELLTWLDSQISLSEQEKSYLGIQASDGQKAQADEKTVALRLVKLLLENDGKLTGTAQLDQHVKQVLVPHLSQDTQVNGHFAVAADLVQHSATGASTGTQDLGLPMATPEDLDCLQMHLLKGNKQEAVQYALNNKLFNHAMIIACGTDKASLANVVKEFLEHELSGTRSIGREPLRVAYSLLGGSGGAAVQEFIPSTSASPSAGAGSLLVQPAGQASASRTPTPGVPLECPSDISLDTLCKWQETAAMILANRSPNDIQALTGLGDVLVKNQWYKAGHACYLLSPTTSLLGGPSIPGVRWSLLGAPNPLDMPTSASDLEAILLTEVIEFALSLVPTVKGQEAYIGFPHLQAYRLVHARHLSDIGLHAKAQKYCDAIGSTLKLATKASPFYHAALLREVKELSDRLSMVSFQDKTGSWISRKVQRPTIDNVWSTLENRFAKFVTGDADEDPAQEERKRKARDAAKGVAGPFAHYSSITPQGPESLSRDTSYADLSIRTTPPPQPISVPNTVSNATAGPKATHHRRSSSYAYGPYGADPYGSYVPQMPETAEEQEQPEQSQDGQSQAQQPYSTGYNEPQYGYVTPQNDSGWWSSANGAQDASPYGSSSSYGQAPTFSPVTEGYGSTDPQGLMSPMGFNNSPTMSSQSFQPQPSKLQNEVASSATAYGEDDDDLGLGNNSNKRKGQTAQQTTQDPASTQTETPAEEPTRKEEPASRQSTSSSWLGRIWRRETASPTSAPIKAKLGEETSFVYDPVEKRWVNKKAGADTPPAAATPPPPRAQTASPAGFSRQEGSSGTPPPTALRATTASPGHTASRDFAPPPPSRPTSALPPSAAAGPPPPAASTGSTPPPRPATTTPSGELPPPPARKPGGAAAKKARSRYVDVFAQDQK